MVPIELPVDLLNQGHTRQTVLAAYDCNTQELVATPIHAIGAELDRDTNRLTLNPGQAATHSQYAVAALDWIFSTPTFRATDFEKHAGIPEPTAKRILRCLENAEVLAVIREARGRRPRVLCLEQLLAVAEGRP